LPPPRFKFRVPYGYRALIADEIDSTIEEAKRRAEAGEAGGLWILAHRQTAGRGRRGRAWESRAGNLMVTLLLRPDVPPARAAELSFVAALAVADTLSELGAPSVALKWPNDVLIGDAKAAGILLESSAASGGRLDWLAIGVGINLAWAPEGTPYPATCLAAHRAAPAPEPECALAALAKDWSRHYDNWRMNGFPSIREAWLARARGLGEPILARLGDGDIEGVFVDLDERGALIVETASGRRSIAAGDVFFARTGA
jgi:BirA family biotin operon repressor/biotin-[acetyl-CoA-carboxylase] ligase